MLLFPTLYHHLECITLKKNKKKNYCRLHHSLLSSFYWPLTLSFQSQIIHIAYIYMRLSIIAVISFQENDGGVRGEVAARLGDVVGEVVAYLVWRT